MRPIVVDSSALVAILFDEEEGEEFRLILRDPEIRMVIGAPTLLETYMVVGSRAQRPPALAIETLLAGKEHEIVAFDEAMVRTAYAAFQAFGKGRHPAALNYGDCMAFAVARTFDAPLLFKGDDFMSTDVRRAR